MTTHQPADPPATTRPTASAMTVVLIVALIGGGVLVRGTLEVERGSAAFYACGFALAVWWMVAAALVGVRRRRSVVRRDDVVTGVVLAVAAFICFAVAAEIARRIDVLEGPIDRLLERADAGALAAVLALALTNAVGEELFFRGALPPAHGSVRAAVLAVVVYTAVTAIGGNVALTIAAAVMGMVFTWERRRTAGLTAPLVTHVLWSTLMIVALPR